MWLLRVTIEEDSYAHNSRIGRIFQLRTSITGLDEPTLASVAAKFDGPITNRLGPHKWHHLWSAEHKTGAWKTLERPWFGTSGKMKQHPESHLVEYIEYIFKKTDIHSIMYRYYCTYMNLFYNHIINVHVYLLHPEVTWVPLTKYILHAMLSTWAPYSGVLKSYWAKQQLHNVKPDE